MNTVVARGAVTASLHATVQSVREAISGMVRVSADDLAEGVGNIIVTTSDQIIGGAFERSEAFRSWFHGSVMVNDDGSPKVMYHGSYRDFNTFDRMASARWRQTSIDTVGSWFSTEPGDTGAGMYANAQGAAIYPVYLAVKRPKYYESFGEMLNAMHEAEGRDPKAQEQRGLGSAEGLRSLLMEQGYDSISLARTNTAELASELVQMRDAVRRARDEEFAAPKGERPMYTSKRERLEGTVARLEAEWRVCGDSTEFDGQLVVIAFEASQIKSAIGNRGTYDPINADMRFSLSAPVRGHSQEFDRWFEGSCVVDDAGEPLVVYHGTTASFDSFKTGRRGAFFADDASSAGMYSGGDDGSNVMPVYLKIARPYRGHVGRKGPEIGDVIAAAKRGGHDGAVVTYDDFPGETAYVAFNPEQIKSALGNRGTYDSETPDIRHSLVATDEPTLVHLRSCAVTAHAAFATYEREVEGGKEPDGDVYFALSNAVSEAEEAFASGLLAIQEGDFALRASTGDGRQLMLTRSAQRLGSYQLTRFDKEGMPWSDTQYLSKGQAVRHFLDESDIGTVVDCGGALPQRDSFDSWFGNSKVVDADGKPLVVYHGTAENFTKFRSGRGGFYFTGDKKAAQAYADNAESESDEATPRLVDAYLSIKNPMVLGRLWYEENVLDEDGDQNWEAVDNMIYEAESLGHDGLILRGFSDFDGMEFVPGAKFGRRMQREYDQYVAFRPEQIKSATGNRGTYDPKDPDIRHSLAGLDPRAQAWHDVATNTTVFLADRIAAGQEAAVFLHETVHRHGRQALPEGRWDALVGQVKAWAQAEPQSPERAIHDAAAARVATAGVAGALADEELFAYAVEEAVARGIEPSAAAVQGSAQAWLQVVVESIQRISDKLLGNDLQGLGGQDLVDLAYALAQLDSPEHGAEVRRTLQEAASEVNDVEPVRSADASFEGVGL